MGWDVLPAAQDPYPCSGEIFPKIGTHVWEFFPQNWPKKNPYLAILHKPLKILKNQTHSKGFFHEKWDPRLGISCTN